MIKISALNDESEEESVSDEEVTKEALEQIALQQYAKALDLQRKGNLKDATQLLKDLLDTELLYDVKKPSEGEKMTGPLLNLKYLCYKNLASMLTASKDYSGAIEAFSAASDLDDTDVTLWHKLGLICMNTRRYELALHAFQRGAECNPKHWPCLDKTVTLLLGLDYKEECISTIHEILQLDPGYLRGLAYRKHIFTVYPYIKDFMEYLNPMYKWNKNDDDPFDDQEAEKLIKEAEDIKQIFIEQQKAEQFKYVLPNLKMKKPITELSWLSVGESLIHMHKYMTENCYSHACYLEPLFDKEQRVEKMEVCEEPKESENLEDSKFNVDEKENSNDKIVDSGMEDENNDMSDKDRAATDTDKLESDIDIAQTEPVTDNPSEVVSDNPTELKTQKKAPVRRRGSALSFLQQWEWCNKRRSGRKKMKEQDDNIYDILRRMVPSCLSPDMVAKKEHQAKESSPDTTDLHKMFDEKNIKADEKTVSQEYFGTEEEQKDVKEFIKKYTQNKRDIIDMLKEYLNILSEKWKIVWPKALSKTFIAANECFNNHIDIPTCSNDNKEEILHYVNVNILVSQFSIDDKLQSSHDSIKNAHDLSIIESIGVIINLKPHIFDGTDCMELTLRYLWIKYHIHLFNKSEDLALDCLYQLLHEFEAMDDHHDEYNLNLVNFTFKPVISENEIVISIQFLERNKKLGTVMDLYERGEYDEVLAIVIDSFEHCKNLAKNQQEEVSLDFAMQLFVILDAYWALNKVECCFKWSLICLHEALKHYFRYTTGSAEYDKWTLTVVKILQCMDHILATEGLSCLDSVSQKELSQTLEDLIRIIGHQVETSSNEMPLNTTIPWIIMHYILQREEDHGRVRTSNDKSPDEIPNPLMVLFIAHEQLGSRGWCCNSKGKLLYFILDTVVPRLHSPILAKSLEQISQHLEQCVYCLFGHPVRKNKLKYLVDHNVTPHSLDWLRAQQLYEIFKPTTLPALEGKVSKLTADTEQLFHRILSHLPPELDPQKYVPDMEKYIKGIDDKLPSIPAMLPYKMRDIYFFLGDYNFKKDERKLAVKYNMLDVIVNTDRLESWAEISLAKTLNLGRVLNSCKNINNNREFLNPAKSIIRCFKRALDLDPTHSNLWIEYGIFVYTVHSFCSRLLKQASESLSMEDFESLEKQKEDMLDTTQKCFTTVLEDLNSSNDSEKANEDAWLHYYMLGKVAEKKNKSPSIYLQYYLQSVKSLKETGATYPSKINYNTPTHLCIEVMELHYRIHSSILKYIEQHENKPIPVSVGKVFLACIEEWKKCPYGKKTNKDGVNNMESDSKPADPVHAANILKRSVSDAGEEETNEVKRQKLESAAAKVRRSASYDTERIVQKDATVTSNPEKMTELIKPEHIATSEHISLTSEIKSNVRTSTEKQVELNKDSDTDKKESSSSSSSSSSSDSSSSDSTSDSSSETSRDTDNSSKSSNDSKKPLTDDEVMTIVSACLDALEDCASRFPQHYKAIYRLAHYHFYYKKGKDIERCRDLMLSNFVSRAGQKLGGLFSERKHSNFFNNIWKIPVDEIDRAGGFAYHMSRSVQLTMEILKEIDDHKTLLDLSLHLQRIPEPDKKYLRDSDREELAQQAFSLCVQSLKGQLTKFSQQADLKCNDIEKQALKCLTLDIYRAYQRAQKQPNSKQFTNMLVEAYKLVCTTPITDNMNLVDLSMKYCQSLMQALKQQATQASIDKSQNMQKKQSVKPVDAGKPSTSATIPVKSDPKPQTQPTSASITGLPKMSAHEMASAFQSYLPMLNDQLSQQTAAALSYLSSISALAGYSQLQNTLQSSIQNTLQNSFQAEFYRQFLGQNLSSLGMPPQKKQKRGPRPSNAVRSTPAAAAQMKPSKSLSGSMQSGLKAAPTNVITSMQKSSSTPLTPSMGTVLPSLPHSMTVNLASFGTSAHGSSHSHSSVHSLPSQAHMSPAIKSAMMHTKSQMHHQQVSPGKTLQEKLAERQKHMPVAKSSSSQEINASISKLPSSLTITKTSISKTQSSSQTKRPEAKKTLPFSEQRPKQINTDEVIVLDDD